MNNNKKDRLKIQVLKDTQEQIREVFVGRMRSSILDMVYQLFEDEVKNLCGPRYRRGRDTEYYRAGSDKGSILAQGQRVLVRKPRIKNEGHDVRLNTYSALQSYDMVSDKILSHIMRGVSSRNYRGLLDDISGGTGLSKSAVSKAFVKASQGSLEGLNSRDLSFYNFSSLMIDGVSFGRRIVVVVLGITSKGEKLILGLREGDTENWELCRDLLESLIDRGLKNTKPYLFIIDGSRALKKAICKVFSHKAVIQRCIRHKERNILCYLPKERHSEFLRRWKKLHGLCHYGDARREHENLMKWLSDISYSAVESLKEAEMETLTTTRLQLPLLLRKTLSSTNPLESAFSIVKTKVGRIKNWRSSSDQVMRWGATALIETERHFRVIKGFKSLHLLEEGLREYVSSLLNVDKKRRIV